MQINKITNNQYPGYTVYEVIDSEVSEGVWYLAINDASKLVNIMVPAGDSNRENMNTVDTTILRFRTELPIFSNKDGTLVFSQPDKLADLLVDLLGEHAAIVATDMGVSLSGNAGAALQASLSPGDTPDVDASKYVADPYEGLEPEVLDVLRSNPDFENNFDGDSFAGGPGSDDSPEDLNVSPLVGDEEGDAQDDEEEPDK